MAGMACASPLKQEHEGDSHVCLTAPPPMCSQHTICSAES